MNHNALSSVNFEGMDKLYHRLDQLEKEAFESVKKQAKYHTNMRKTKVNRIAQDLLTGCFNDFAQKAREEYENTPYSTLAKISVDRRCCNFFHPEILNEIKDIMQKKYLQTN